MEVFWVEHPLGTVPGLECSVDLIADCTELSVQDGHRGEPDGLTAQVRFWEGA